MVEYLGRYSHRVAISNNRIVSIKDGNVTEGNLFFQLINKLYGQSSVIITSNKGPEDWAELLGDQAIATAILDRLIHRCEVINFNDDSYRMTNRETIFGNNLVLIIIC